MKLLTTRPLFLPAGHQQRLATENLTAHREPSIQPPIGIYIRSETPLLSHLFLLSPLPAQLSIGRRHRLNHKRGGHVAVGRRGTNER